MRRFLLSLVACGVIAPVTSAFVTRLPVTPPAARPKADIQDLVFRSEQRLYKIRMHIQVNGQSAAVSWEGVIGRAFAFADRNGDGSLNAAEVAKMIPPAAFVQGMTFLFNGRQQGASLKELDTNKDGKVDRTEFGAHYRKIGLGTIQVNIQQPNAQAERLTKAFLQSVGSGEELTPSELARAWSRLHKLDQDEDEIITSQELLQRTASPFYRIANEEEVEESLYGGYLSRSRNPRVAINSLAFMSIKPGESAQATADKILQMLRAAREPYLGLTAGCNNSRMPQFMRKALRQIEMTTLVAWLEQPPDLELSVQLGVVAEGINRVMGRFAPAAVRVHATGRNPMLEKAVTTGEDGWLRLVLPGDLVEFARAGSNISTDGTVNYYRQQFKTEAEAKRYMDRAQMQSSPQFQVMVALFDHMDRDGDGKLFVEEFNACLDLVMAGVSGQVFVQVVDQGRGLFDLIDVNHDQRLTQREVANAVRRFEALDRNRDGVLQRIDLPRQVRLTVSQGQVFPQYAGFVVDGTGMVISAGQRGPAKGPTWFRKMDRNKDGDVSAREFLGEPADFARLDTDGDGLISAAEAQKAGKK